MSTHEVPQKCSAVWTTINISIKLKLKTNTLHLLNIHIKGYKIIKGLGKIKLGAAAWQHFNVGPVSVVVADFSLRISCIPLINKYHFLPNIKASAIIITQQKILILRLHFCNSWLVRGVQKFVVGKLIVHADLDSPP